MSSDEDTRVPNKKIFKNPVEVQKARLDRLMDNIQKPVFIPEKKDIRPPRAFQPHEFVRNVMGIDRNRWENCSSIFEFIFHLFRRECWCGFGRVRYLPWMSSTTNDSWRIQKSWSTRGLSTDIFFEFELSTISIFIVEKSQRRLDHQTWDEQSSSWN